MHVMGKNSMKSKKVLFTSHTANFSKFNRPFMRWFTEQGYEVHYASAGEEEVLDCDKHFTIPFERSPFKINNLSAIKQLKKIIDSEQYEIIHTHTPMGSFVTRLAAIKARKHGTRVIYTAHGFHFFKGAPLLNWLVYYPIEKLMATITDTLITINNEDYEIAKSKFKTDVQYVPGVGIDPKKFDIKMTKKQKTEMRKSLELVDSDFVMIYPAELSKRKNQLWLINAIAKLMKSNSKLHLLLPGKDSLNGKCQNLVSELGLGNNIHFLGYRDDTPQLLRISHLALSTSKQEGLPLNIMEAMCIGLPIVATNCRGNRDLIKNDINNRIITLNNQAAFTRNIEDIYAATDLNKKVAANDNVQQNIDKYLLNNVLTAMEKIYTKKPSLLIIPTCTDLNRGDQALVLETKKVINQVYGDNDTYMMSNGETIQCESMGLNKFSDILKHPSRFDKKSSNISYGKLLKLRWGIIATYDLFISLLILNNNIRKIIMPLLSNDVRNSLKLYKDSESVFVKGGGFLHDYTKGVIGLYTMYYQTYHLRLAVNMGKKLYIMPNSYGPFKNKSSAIILNKIIDKCEIVTSRESISANSSTNGLGRDIDQYPDLALFLDKGPSTHVDEYFEKNNVPIDKAKTVAITVRPYRFYGYDNPDLKYNNYKKAFVEFIEYLQFLNLNVLLVVHTRAENDHEDDEHCINEIYELLPSKERVKIINNDKFNCYDIKNVYDKCSYVIGTRFHSVIFSLEQSIPCIAVTYGGNKGDGIMKDIGIEDYAIKIGELDFESLKSKFILLQNNEKTIKQKTAIYLREATKKREQLIAVIRDTR